MTEQLRVAVIEDDKTMREGIVKGLEQMGCLVVGTADSLKAALELVGQLSGQEPIFFLMGT